MKSIRIGNDIRIEWPMVLSGDVEKLKDLDLTVEVRPSAKIIDTHNYADENSRKEVTVMMNGGLGCLPDIGDGKEHCKPCGTRPHCPTAPVLLPYHIEDNTLIAMWTADRQFATGDYDIMLYAHKNEGGQAVCDQYRFVRLVAHSAQADAPDDSGIEAVITMQPLTLSLSGLSAYEVAVVNGFQGSVEEWLESLKAGKLSSYVSVESIDNLPQQGDESTGYIIGTKLYIYVGTGGDTLEGKYKDVGEFRGPQGAPGSNGKSAYELAVEGGYEGSVEEWLLSLKGRDGVDGVNGADGLDGEKGKDGVTPLIRWNNNRIEQSTDNGKSWWALSDKFNNKLYIKGYVTSADKLPKNALVGDMYGVGPIYGDDDVEQTKPYYQVYVNTVTDWAKSATITKVYQGDTELPQSAENNEIILIKKSTDNYLVYKYVNGSWNLLANLAEIYVEKDDIVNKGDNIFALVQSEIENQYELYERVVSWRNSGTFTSITAGIVNELGDSENAVMSQKAVTEVVNNINDSTGISDYPTFSENTNYSTGDTVNYQGKLYQFTADHAAGEWTGSDVESWNISKKNKSDFLIEMKKIPGISNRGYDDRGNYVYTPTPCLTYCLDVSKFSHVEFSQNIYTQFAPIGNYAFFNDSLTRISGERPNRAISVGVPSNAKFLIFTCAKDVAETLNVILTGANYDYSLSVDDIVLIDGLWDGECYNLSFFGEVENERAKLKANVIAVIFAQSDIINRIRFKNADTNNEHTLMYLSGDKSDISSWKQSETDVEREYYLKKQDNNDGSFSFFFEEDEIMCDAELFFFPNQTSWNNGVTLKDKGGNIMLGTQGRNNNMPSATAHPYTHEVLIPSGYVVGLNGINVYMKKPLTHEYTEPTTPNLVRQDMMNKYDLDYSDTDNITHNINLYIGKEGAACSAIYIAIKALTRYIAITGGNGNFVAGSLKPDYPLICMDKDKNIIKAYSQNDVEYTNGSSSFGYSALFIFETPENAAYVSLVVFKSNEAPSEGFDKLNVVISSFDEIVEAVRGSGSSAENVGVVTGKEFDSVMKRTQKSIWILGDSISATGYGGALTAPISSGSFGGWVKYFIDIIKPYAVANAARGGYTITDASNTFSGEILQNAEKSYIKELEDLIANYNSELVKAPDYMLIVGCTNDFGKTRSNPDGWSHRSFVMDEDLNSELLNPNNWDYDTFMEHKFISDESNNIIPINNVPMFKLAGAIRYLIQRVGTLFPNCRYMICTSLQAPSDWLSQNQCNKEIKWIANRLSIPVIDVSGQGNTPMLWDMRKQDGTQPRRFINDGFHPYGASDSEGVSFITAGAAYQGKLIAEAFKYYCQIETEKDINVVDYTDETGYPHDNNVN